MGMKVFREHKHDVCEHITLNEHHRCSEGCSLNIEQCLRAGGDVGADLLRVQVVVDQAVDDGGQLGLHQRVALLLQGSPEKAAQGVAQLLGELHDLVLCGVAGDEVVQVGDDVDAEGAGQLVPGLRDGQQYSCSNLPPFWLTID